MGHYQTYSASTSSAPSNKHHLVEIIIAGYMWLKTLLCIRCTQYISELIRHSKKIQRERDDIDALNDLQSIHKKYAGIMIIRTPLRRRYKQLLCKFNCRPNSLGPLLKIRCWFSLLQGAGVRITLAMIFGFPLPLPAVNNDRSLRLCWFSWFTG